jgi:hypothetical protein
MNEEGYGRKLSWHNLIFCLHNLLKESEVNCKKPVKVTVFMLIFESRTSHI